MKRLRPPLTYILILGVPILGLALFWAVTRLDRGSARDNYSIGSSAPADNQRSFDAKESQAQRVAAHRAALKAHELEPKSETWSARMNASISERLAGLALTPPALIRSVDCRSESCVVTAEFQSADLARSQSLNVMLRGKAEGCGSEVTLEDAIDASATYTATIIYRCHDVTAQR